MEDHRAALRIITWFLLVSSGGAIASRLTTKWLSSRRFNLDDLLILVALACSVASGIAVSIAANNGLGEEALPVSRARGDTVLKCIYVAETFFVLSVCITKLSVATLLSLLFTQLQHRRLINAFSSGILLFAFPSLFVVLFQCHVPRVWALFSNGNSCVDMVAFWRYFGVVNIISELSLLSLPILMIYRVQIPAKKKIIVVSCFAVRSCDIATTATQLAYTSGFRSNGSPPFFSVWPWFMCSQVLQAVTIVSACVPYLRQFLESFPSGLFQSDEIRRRGLNYADVTDGFHIEDSASTHSGTRTYILRELDSNTVVSSVESGKRTTMKSSTGSSNDREASKTGNQYNTASSNGAGNNRQRDMNVNIVRTVDVTGERME